MFRFAPPPQFHPAVGVLNATAAALFAALAFAGLSRTGGSADPPDVTPANGVLLFVVDGLRADEAADPGRMPFLASRPHRAVARVETPVPCSAAAIQTWVHGTVPSAWAMLTDFAEAPVSEGGLIEAVRRSGRPVRVCGPTLWTGRYAEWADAVVADGTFGRRDEEVVAAAVAEAGRLDGLLVAHLLSLDAAGHRRASSDEVADTLRWIDASAQRLAESLPPGAAMLVVSDHGRSAAGGHAGGEAAVRRTPVVLVGGGPLPADSTQRDTHAVLAGLLGVPPRSGPAGREDVPWWAVLAVVGLGVTRPRIARDAGSGAVVGFTALLTLVLAAAAWWADLVWVAGAALLCAVCTCRPTVRWFDAGGVALGAALATAASFAPAFGGPPWLGVVIATGLAGVVAAGCRGGGGFGGPVLAVALVTLPVAAGQGVSLSTLDTRWAFGVVEGPGGVSAAAAVILAANALPLLPLAWAVAERRDAADFLADARPVLVGVAAAGVAIGSLDAAVRVTAEWVVLGVAAWAVMAAGSVEVAVPTAARVEVRAAS